MQVIPASVFPPLHWVQKFMQGAQIGVADNYVKQTIRNRYIILGVNGPLMLTVPVQGQKGQKVPLHEVRIFGQSWRRNHWHSIQSAYGKSAYFIYAADALEELFERDYSFLLDFQLAAWEAIQPLTGLPEWKLSRSASERSAETEHAWEPAFNPGNQRSYLQVFADRMPFVPGLSLLDAAMNLGPQTLSHVQRL